MYQLFQCRNNLLLEFIIALAALTLFMLAGSETACAQSSDWQQFENNLAISSAQEEASDDLAVSELEAHDRERYQNEQLQQKLDAQQREIDELKERQRY